MTMRPNELEALAVEFWENASITSRDLELAIPLAVPASVIRLKDLRPVVIWRWLLRQGIRLSLAVQDRPLDGCIVAYRGHAVLFLTAGLEGCYERMILAHELGHWLAHYHRPRQRVLRRLGPSVQPVLDGERPTTTEEEVAGVLAGVVLGPHQHYMERDFDPRRIARTDQVERDATALACELCAPRRELFARAAARGLAAKVDSWVRLLREEFAFPESWACVHAARQLSRCRERRRFTDYLGL
jgi:hypothetical protein